MRLMQACQNRNDPVSTQLHGLTGCANMLLAMLLQVAWILTFSALQ